MPSQKLMFKNWVITYKCFQICVHHAKITRVVYYHSISGWYIRSSCKELPELFTDAPFKAGTCIDYTKNYHGSLLTFVTRENTRVDREECLKESKIDLMARETRID